uniref:Uncharacterized protein n=1 Tax=Glossina pallidipes TaxID=7398 RepID=A0A1A9Z371_GLOPL
MEKSVRPCPGSNCGNVLSKPVTLMFSSLAIDLQFFMINSKISLIASGPGLSLDSVEITIAVILLLQFLFTFVMLPLFEHPVVFTLLWTRRSRDCVIAFWIWTSHLGKKENKTKIMSGDLV